jgi:hypothetical protein
MCNFIHYHQKGSSGWPGGKYVLLKPTGTACPDGWKDRGWIFQDTKDGNNRSEILHVDGHVGRNYVVRSFCIKTEEQTSTTSWPKGTSIRLSPS